jgi:hypothetical protein
MEGRFGRGFEDVRVHSDTDAVKSAAALSANAYTAGREIYFAAGKYAPGTSDGDRLLAHELAHTVQQSDGRMPNTSLSLKGAGVVVGDAHDPLEREADDAAKAVSAGLPNQPPMISDREGAIRRQPANSEDGGESWAARAWSRTGGRVVRGVEHLAEGTIEWARAWLESHVPALMEFLRSDPIETLRHRIGEALDSTFGGIFASIQRNGLFGALAALANEGAETLSGALAAVAADPCGALRTLVESVIHLQKWIASTEWGLLRSGASAVAKVASSLWNDLAMPAWDAVKKLAGSAWQWVSDRAVQIWEW